MKHPLFWPKVPLRRRDQLPYTSGVYAVLDWKCKILYIGMSGNLHARWKGLNHHRYPQARRLIGAKIAFISCDDYRTFETRLIRRYRPKWNNTKIPKTSSWVILFLQIVFFSLIGLTVFTFLDNTTQILIEIIRNV